MQDFQSSLKIAVCQSSPVLFQKRACAEKAAALIRRASAAGARLVVFPEAFIPGYPRYLSFGMHIGGTTQGGRRDYARYYENSVLPDGEELSLVRAAAAEAGCFVSVGISERDEKNGSLYCTNLIIDDRGEIAAKHRKLKPTGAERCIWGEGGKEDMRALQTPFGVLGCLICWENYMPLARTDLYEQGVTIYLAPNADSRREWQATLRHIAQEGRCFVLGCNQYVTRAMYPQDLEDICALAPEIDEISAGGSCIISPTGKYLAAPCLRREEMLLCDLPLSKLAASRLDFDPCGHYSCPNIYKLERL